MCVGATEQSSPTAEMQDSRLQTKDKNKHVEKYFKRPTLTNVRKYINEVKNTRCEFYVLLTVQLGSVLVNNQHDAQFFFFVYVYSSSLHVSSTPVLIIRTINCINMTSGIWQLCWWRSSVQVWMELEPVPSRPAHLTVTYIFDIYQMLD